MAATDETACEEGTAATPLTAQPWFWPVVGSVGGLVVLAVFLFALKKAGKLPFFKGGKAVAQAPPSIRVVAPSVDSVVTDLSSF